MSKSVIEELKKVLANSYLLYLKTQNYHWNVTGPQFNGLHKMFEEQYDDLAEAIDEIAERIRILGEKAPGTFSAYKKLAVIEDGDEDLSSKDMIKQLADDQKKIGEVIDKALKAAEKAGDNVTLDLMSERLAVHQKNAWMLKSSM